MEQPQPPTKLKLKMPNLPSASIASAGATPSRTTTPAGSPPPQTPGGTKIKLVRKPTGLTPGPTTESGDGAAPSAMAPPPAPSAANGATTAQGPKVVPKVKIAKPTKTSPKKRAKPADDDDDDVPLANGTSKEPQKKKPKIMVIKTPSGSKPAKSKPPTTIVKVKPIGKTPTRPTGICYDTEAEDKELDPVIEDQFILRMMEGEHLAYLREHVEKKTIGVHKSQGGPDFSLKFLDEQGRRAVLTIQGQLYAAILLDLPTITEGMKSWDKKAMIKSADICQMMLVFAKVKDEEEAKTVPLPKAVEHGHRWPHGITPPMHDARKRRFRKRLSKLEVQNKEAEVERLLALDKEAVSTKFEFIDNQPTLTAGDESGEEYEEEEEEDADADGEVEDYFGDAEGEQEMPDQSFDDDALEAEFMDAFGEEEPIEAADQPTPGVGGVTDAVTPATAHTGTPAAQTEDSGTEAAGGAGAAPEQGAQDESGDEDDDDEDDDDMDGDGDDDRHDEKAGVRAEIAILKKELAEKEESLTKVTSSILRSRLQTTIKNYKAEIKLKQSSIGEADDD
ncbi:transcription initiation factor TFIID subunit 7 [Naviculisporaceae sp. PSN 640]